MTAYEKYLERKGVLNDVRALSACTGIEFSVSIPSGCSPAVKDEFTHIFRAGHLQAKIMGLIAQEATSEIERCRQAACMEIKEIMRGDRAEIAQQGGGRKHESKVI